MSTNRNKQSQFLSPRVGKLPWMVLTLCISAGCESVEGPELDHPCVSWCNTVAPWKHDGNPYEGDDFIIYSDGVGIEAMQKLAAVAEEALPLVKSALEVDSDSLLVYPPGQDKLHIYTYNYRFPQDWGAQAYYGGFIIYSPDHKERTEVGSTETAQYRRTVTHELTHVVQGLLLGSVHPSLVDEWLSEGIAEYISGGSEAAPVMNKARLNQLTSTYGELNPIAQHIGDDYTPEVGHEYYYPMYGLAVRYLADPAGANTPLARFRDIFLDMRGETPCYVGGVCPAFATAFNARVGINLGDYEARFFEIIRAFLH